jgi:hypothetical protein
MKRKDEHRPRATATNVTVEKRGDEGEPRFSQERPAPRETRPLRHERGRQGYALADR